MNWVEFSSSILINSYNEFTINREIEIIKTNKQIEYLNIPIAFDIETSSFYDNDEKKAIMYVWAIAFYDRIYIGRYWWQLIILLNSIIEKCEINEKKRIIIYVHNLSYEFQFIRKYFQWKKVFSIKKRKVLTATTIEGIEFRCSYMLSGLSLERINDITTKYKMKKLSGFLDYSKIRHSETPLTEKEILYILNDVKIIIGYILECIENDGNITKIPLTNTGYVRNYCRNKCYYGDGTHKKNSIKYLRYRELITQLTLTETEYRQCKKAFQGGFTHANAFNSSKKIINVRSFDFNSSYPTVMLSEQFPMSSPQHITIKSIDDFNNKLNNYCCIFDITFTDIEAITMIDNPISLSKCSNIFKPIVDNGRIVTAEQITITITEQDYKIFTKFYKWKSIKVSNFMIFKKGYLPKNFILAILKLYHDKTTLKGFKGQEDIYLKSKGMLNATFGMCCTDIIQEGLEYINDEWTESKKNVEKEILKYNKSKKRFLYYPWGVWITAYARKNLFSGIYNAGLNYVYSDTDSVKLIDNSEFMTYIENYNKLIVEKIKKCLRFHKIDENMCTALTVKNEPKTLGLWDDEGVYNNFKTLGCKRYMVEKNGKISFTVSGLNKKIAIPYLRKKAINDFKKHNIKNYKYSEIKPILREYISNYLFENFDDDLYIPPKFTGKNTHTYIDELMVGKITDYMGNTAEYEQNCGVHLEPADYHLSQSEQYVKYLKGIQAVI